MKTQETKPQTDQNWVDYCDSLCEEYFSRYVLTKQTSRPAEKLAEPVSLMVARQESAREVA